MPAIFRNRQWAVTESGLKTVEPDGPYTYNINASRLLEMAGAGRSELYDWPIQMAGKTWIDLRAFEEAFKKALEHHADKYEGEIDQELLDKSFKRAREIVERRSGGVSA